MDELKKFILNKRFPCIMAKAVLTTGHLKTLSIDNVDNKNVTTKILQSLYGTVDSYRREPYKLHSFILLIKDERLIDFKKFEMEFWNILRCLNLEDKKRYAHDSRVDKDPESPHYSYSLKEEAFFILTLHPHNQRLSRRYKYPAIVFNPHQQFEKLRELKKYTSIRNIIRMRDTKLQGFINPMVSDFGEASEVYQYLGRSYAPDEQIPFQMLRG